MPIHEINCPNCGSSKLSSQRITNSNGQSITVATCQYCGSQFSKDNPNDVINLIEEQNKLAEEERRIDALIMKDLKEADAKAASGHAGCNKALSIICLIMAICLWCAALGACTMLLTADASAKQATIITFCTNGLFGLLFYRGYVVCKRKAAAQ